MIKCTRKKSFKEAPWGFLTARDLGADIARALKDSTCKTNKTARYDRTIVLWKGELTQYSLYVMESRVSSNCPRNIQRPSLSENRKELSCFLRWNFLRFAGPLNIFEPFLVPVDKNNSYDQF